jgi:hypothetical protein
LDKRRSDKDKKRFIVELWVDIPLKEQRPRQDKDITKTRMRTKGRRQKQTQGQRQRKKDKAKDKTRPGKARRQLVSCLVDFLRFYASLFFPSLSLSIPPFVPDPLSRSGQGGDFASAVAYVEDFACAASVTKP